MNHIQWLRFAPRRISLCAVEHAILRDYEALKVKRLRYRITVHRRLAATLDNSGKRGQNFEGEFIMTNPAMPQ